MIDLKTIAGGLAVVGSLGLAALGLGAGVANAAPSFAAPETTWAQDPGWGHGHGHGGGGDWRGPRWAPPPPPYYGYGGYGGYGAPCVTGPLGFVHLCA
jgi:hypothetical protein